MREALAMIEYENERKTKGDISEETAEKIANIVNELEKDTLLRLSIMMTATTKNA